MYKIIDKIPENIPEDKIQEKYVVHSTFRLDVMARRAGQNMEEKELEKYRKDIEKNFSNIPKDFDPRLSRLIIESDLNIELPFIFMDEYAGVKYLYDESLDIYIILKYK